MREIELEQQFRVAQAKLDRLVGEPDRLDQAVLKAALHTAPSAHQ
jgi:hypothetical protein